jgi:phosphatidylinositol alpha-1,6-mannosyltransferase
METLAAGVWRSVCSVRPDAIKISHGGQNRALIWWVPACLARLAWLSLRGQPEYVLCGDALMNALCAPLLRVFRVPQATMIMGLDVTYENRLYRALVHPALRSAARVIAISSATADKAREAGVPADRIVVLRLGVPRPPAGRPSRRDARAALRRRLALADDQLVLLTLGRLVRRKGARWFTENVLPHLDEHVHYVVAGQGPEEGLIRTTAETVGVSKRLHLLGRVDDDAREELMSGADIFLAPNIPVPGDMEGFGLVTVEAAMRGTPVVAARLEGIKDAVANRRTGILLPPSDTAAWVSELSQLLAAPAKLPALGESFQANAEDLYSEEGMGRALSAHLGLGYAEPT